MKQTITLFLVLMILFSCKKEDDISCDNALLQICNTTTNQMVLYGWNTNVLEDTIFPGQCVTKDFGRVAITYGFGGNEDTRVTSRSNFYTSSATYSIEMESCNRVMDAPGGYIDISHCFNGIMDNGEFGVDCGGNCPPCDSINIPCATSLQADKIIWQAGSNDDLNSASEIITDSKLRANFRFYSGQQMDLILPVQAFPTADRQFIIGTAFNEASIVYNDRTQNMSPAAGSIIYFISTGDGTGKIEFCDVPFMGSFTNKTGSASLGLSD